MEKQELEQRIITFYGDQLLVIRTPRGFSVGIKSVCEALSIDDRGQLQRIGRSQDLAFGLEIYPLSTPGGTQRVACLQETKLAIWLGSIQVGRLKQLRIDKLTLYRQELADAISHHFHQAHEREPMHKENERKALIVADGLPEQSFVPEVAAPVVEGMVVSSENSEVISPEDKQRMITTLLTMPPPEIPESLTTTSSEVDRSLREATLAAEDLWDITMQTPTFTSSSQLKVYLGTPQAPLDLDEAQTKIRELGASTVITARLLMGLWNLRQHNRALSINGSAAISVEELLAWRGLKKHHRTISSTSLQRTDGHRTIHKQRLLCDLELLAACCVRGHYIASVKGKQMVIYINGAYLRYSIVTTPNLWGEQEILGFFVAPGDWIISSDINSYLTEIDRRVFLLNPQNEMHELRLALYLVELWRQQEKQIDQPLKMAELLQVSMIPVPKYMSRFIERIQQALDRLWELGILGEPPQCLTPIDQTQSRWSREWLTSYWRLVPPATIVERHARRQNQLKTLAQPKRRRKHQSNE
jgi:hypothetical protein